MPSRQIREESFKSLVFGTRRLEAADTRAWTVQGSLKLVSITRARETDVKGESDMGGHLEQIIKVWAYKAML